MTATAARYRSPYVSEILGETDGNIDDCAVSTAIMLGADWTLGELLVRPDGDQRDVIAVRETVRKVLGPGDRTGGLTLHDANDMLQALDPELKPLPRYAGQALEPGQSAAGATLRLTWAEFRELIRRGHVGLLCGIPSGVGDADSPLRTKAAYDGYKHVIHVSDGREADALVKDPLTRRKPGWRGERVKWRDLREFTEAKVDGRRAFGTDDAIACAVVKVGDETESARTMRQLRAAVGRKDERIDILAAKVRLAEEGRDKALVDLGLAIADRDIERDALAECLARLAADCNAVEAERDSARAALARQDARVAQAVGVLTGA